MPRAYTSILLICSSGVLLACSETPLEPASFAEHCGVAGPVRLRELAPGQSLGNFQHIGDRFYYTIGTPVPGQNSSPYAALAERSTWSTGLCGESPVHLADDLVSVFTVERWPGVLLACQEGTGIVSLDPVGVSPPHTLFPSSQCNSIWGDAFAWTDHGVVALADPAAPISALHLFPYPEDPRADTSEPVTLLDAVDTSVRTRSWPHAVYAITDVSELVRVDLADRSVHPEQSAVRGFELSADRRYLLWMDATVRTNEGGSTVGLISLRDSTTGISTTLGESPGPPSPFSLRWADRGVVVFEGGQRIHFLPDLTFVDIPNGYSLDYQRGPLADDRWLLGGITFIAKVPAVAVLDLQDGTIEPLFARPSQLVGPGGDDLLVLEAPGCCIEGTFRSEGPLWRVPLDGSEARKIADRATRFTHQPDPLRMVTAIDLAADLRGALVVIDLETRAEQRIDDHVLFGAARLALGDDPTLLTWVVHDGARSGIWTARLLPPESE